MDDFQIQSDLPTVMENLAGKCAERLLNQRVEAVISVRNCSECGSIWLCLVLEQTPRSQAFIRRSIRRFAAENGVGFTTDGRSCPMCKAQFSPVATHSMEIGMLHGLRKSELTFHGPLEDRKIDLLTVAEQALGSERVDS